MECAWGRDLGDEEELRHAQNLSTHESRDSVSPSRV